MFLALARSREVHDSAGGDAGTADIPRSVGACPPRRGFEPAGLDHYVPARGAPAASVDARDDELCADPLPRPNRAGAGGTPYHCRSDGNERAGAPAPPAPTGERTAGERTAARRAGA